jgi:hypothetical protein
VSAQSEIHQLRERLEFRKDVQREILELRTWMIGRGEAHDLRFIEATDPYVSWLASEIADVEQRIAALERTGP